MKKAKGTIYFRYEFSNEAGSPEGGDIFQFSTLTEVQEMTTEILKVAQSDNVAINLTIGEEKPFFGFLKKVGMSRQDVEKEIVDEDFSPSSSEKKASKKPSKKKSASKTKVKSKAKTKKK
jgi:hypothetical protein